MKTVFIIFSLLFFGNIAHSQSLFVDSTRFITGTSCCTQINFAIPTADKGILFVGQDAGNPGGIIPAFFDVSDNGNVLIGKIDSNQKISWIKVYGGSQADGAGSACQTPDGGYAVLCGTASNDGDVTGFIGETDIWLLRIDGSGNLLWEKCYGSPGQEGAISIANTFDHGLIILGSSNGSGHDVPFHYGSTSTFDWVVLKTDSIGNLEWCKDLGTSNDEGQTGAILAIDSAYYLISNTGSYDHDCTDTAWHPGVPTSGFDLYLLKLNDTGKVLWDSSYGGTNTDGANCAFFDTRDSSIVINGFTYSDNYMVTGYQGDGDIWAVKVNKNGTLLWQKTLGTSYEDYGTGISANPEGGYISFGWTHPGIVLGGGGDCFLYILDNLGNLIADKVLGGTGYDESSCILHYLNGYAAFGSSDADFTEGTTYGDFDGGGPFISYLDSGKLGVNTQIPTTSFAVYPNPAKNKLKINFAYHYKGKIEIINSLEQTVYTAEISQQSVNIDVSGLTCGVYFVKCQGQDGSLIIKKLIKN